MKHKFLIIFLLIFFSQLTAQEKKITLGVPDETELKMNRYIKDSTANAVVLHEYGNAAIKYEDGEVKLFFDYYVKIKILNQKALDLAEVTIPLRRSATSRQKERVTNIKAISITPSPEGVYKKTWLKKENIFKEDYNANYTLAKFAIPNVVSGSIIEYKYTLTSPFLYNFKAWEFQTDIPKIYSEYETSIPGNYKYNIKLSGKQKLDINKSDITLNTFRIGNNSADCAIATYVIRDIPAFKEEDYMLAASNYKSKISYELEQIEFFDGKKQNYTKSWKDADYELKTEDNLGIQSKKSAFFKKQLPENLYASKLPLDRAKGIYYFLQDKLTWNGEDEVFGKKSVKNAFEKGLGSSTELNLILLNSLRAADIEAHLMLLATREKSLPTKLYPVLSEFNYLIVKAVIDNKTYLLDLADKEMAFGQLPYKCLNLYGRVFDFKKGSYWEDINTNAYTTHRTLQMQLKLTEDGDINGKMRRINSGYFGIAKRKAFNESGKEQYIEAIENSYDEIDLQIDELKVSNETNKEKAIAETISFNINTNSGVENQKIYFYPFIFNRMDQNPFALTARNYPIDFGFPFNYTYLINLELPDNMEFVDTFDSKIMMLDNRMANMSYKPVIEGNSLKINLSLKFKTAVFLEEDYEGIKKLFNEFIHIQNLPVAIRKK